MKKKYYFEDIHILNMCFCNSISTNASYRQQQLFTQSIHFPALLKVNIQVHKNTLLKHLQTQIIGFHFHPIPNITAFIHSILFSIHRIHRKHMKRLTPSSPIARNRITVSSFPTTSSRVCGRYFSTHGTAYPAFFLLMVVNFRLPVC